MPLPKKGLEHGVDHPSGLCARPKHLRTQGKELCAFRRHSQRLKVADAVLEAAFWIRTGRLTFGRGSARTRGAVANRDF